MDPPARRPGKTCLRTDRPGEFSFMNFRLWMTLRRVGKHFSRTSYRFFLWTLWGGLMENVQRRVELLRPLPNDPVDGIDQRIELTGRLFHL
jgi:hypothetical protein